MAERIHISPMGMVRQAGWSTVTWQFSWPRAEPFQLQFSLPEEFEHLLASPERGDPALVAGLLRAMRMGLDVSVEAPVCPTLLDGLDTLQGIWARWRQATCKRVDIDVAEERSEQSMAPPNSALVAYSGGVDASFTLFRHLAGVAGRNNRSPMGALLVHGMDIPLHELEMYEHAAGRTERMLAGTGVELVRVRSNTRQLKQPWEDSFGLQLSSVFVALQGSYRYGLRGSGEPYDALVLPWGSTPLTDRLASTACMALEHDGSDTDRTEKVAWLARHTGACDLLRVCWEGEDKSVNCGECEKCTRTMLNFWATGLAVPRAFDSPLTLRGVRSLSAQNDVQRAYLVEIYRHAQAHHSRNDPILRALGQKVGQRGWRRLARRAWRVARNVLRA